MIVTVTLNPAIDKTALLDRLRPGDLNRLINISQDPGGKGINVSKTIRALGGRSIATGFLAGDSGHFIERSLDEMGIDTDFVYIAGETRVNLKLIEGDGTLTELNELGPSPDAVHLSMLTDRLLQYASPGTIFVLSGSIPREVPSAIYAQLLRLLKTRGAVVFVDADGEVLDRAVTAGPYLIKPNLREFRQLLGLPAQSELSRLIENARFLFTGDLRLIPLSLGEEGAIFFEERRYTRVAAPQVAVRSVVGAGDAMVAALALAKEGGLSVEDSIRMAMGAASAACMTDGTRPPDQRAAQLLSREIGDIVWSPY